jgi:hypothetical protein
MKRLLILNIIVLVFSLVMTADSLLHFSFLRNRLAITIELIDKNYIDRSKYAGKELIDLNSRMSQAAGGERYLSNLQTELWWHALLGFGLLSILSLISAAWLYKESKIMESTQKTISSYQSNANT